MFRGVVPFVAVGEEKSFRRAAGRLGVSPAAISKAVQGLEAGVGLTLVSRDARAVTLTREGELFFERCRQAVAAVEGARAALEPSRLVPEGELAVSAPFIVTSLLAPALALLRARYPRLSFRVTIHDRLSRLAEESVDVAVRVGPLPDSSLVARRLRATRLITIASPGYLARRGAPRRPADIDQHDALVSLAPNGKPRPWLFASGPREVPATLLIDHGPSLVEAALAGLGVTQAFDFMVEALLRDGQLVQVLEDEVAEGPPVHAVCTPGRRAAARIRAAFEVFADAFARAAR